MTRTMTLLLALAFAVPALALAQSTSSPSPTQPNRQMTPPVQSNPPVATDSAKPGPGQSNQATGNDTNAQSGQSLKGTISADGKTLTCADKTYTISNPNSVRAFAGQPVTVSYQMDTNNSIHIDSVSLGRQSQ